MFRLLRAPLVKLPLVRGVERLLASTFAVVPGLCRCRKPIDPIACVERSSGVSDESWFCIAIYRPGLEVECYLQVLQVFSTLTIILKFTELLEFILVVTVVRTDCTAVNMERGVGDVAAPVHVVCVADERSSSGISLGDCRPPFRQKFVASREPAVALRVEL